MTNPVLSPPAPATPNAMNEDDTTGAKLDDEEEEATKGKKLASSDLLGNVKHSPEWCLAEELPAALDKYEKLWLQEDPEEECYKSKYEAREVLEAVLLKLETHLYSKKLVKKEEEEAEREGHAEAISVRSFLTTNIFWPADQPAKKVSCQALGVQISGFYLPL